MEDQYFIGIDVGTLGTKVVIIDIRGNEISSGFKEHRLVTPRSGWAEQEPQEWWLATQSAVREALAKSSIKPSAVLGIGITGQQTSIVCVDRKGTVLRRALIWLDRRAHRQCDRIRAEIGEKTIYETTGVRADPSYVPPRLMWLKENEPKTFKRTFKLLGSSSYIAYKLTGEFMIDVAMATTSGILNVRQRTYAEELLQSLGIPIEIFPKLVSSTSIAAQITREAAESVGLKEGTPVVLAGGDVPCNAVGGGAVVDGRALLKFGTAADLEVCVDRLVLDPSLRFASYIHCAPKKYVLIAGSIAGGISYRWFRDQFGQHEVNLAKQRNVDPYEIMDEEAQNAELGSKGLIFLPYMIGEQSPIWDPMARGVFFGISVAHGREHFIRAILEGVALSVRHRMQIIEDDLKIPIKELRVVGGAAKSKLWMEIISDVTGKNVLIPKVKEAGALGAALCASVASGTFKNLEEACDETVHISKIIRPHASRTKAYASLLELYKKLYENNRALFQSLAEFIERSK